ncbi:MAG: type II secretion system protein GspE, partial [bacterium]|nr:type II secretion system protein GspE [bacterium]
DKHGDHSGDLYCGTGCELCHYTGYKGRIGIYELLILNEELRDIITHNPSLGDLKAAAQKTGMKTLREDGLNKAFQGLTTVEELIRITES